MAVLSRMCSSADALRTRLQKSHAQGPVVGHSILQWFETGSYSCNARSWRGAGYTQGRVFLYGQRNE